MYRIICKYEPNHPSLCGSGGGEYHFGRGKWRVVDCYKLPRWARVCSPVFTMGDELGDELGLASVEPKRAGTLVNPRKVLQQYLNQRRAA